MTETHSRKLVIIDGNSLLYRAFYALPPLQNRRGEYTNAVYGFTTMLTKLLESEQPDYIAVAFDPAKPSFRVRIDQSYKAQREKTPPELSEQVERTRDILKAMKIPIFVVDDFEADDVIGTLADQFVEEGREVTVVSGDADLLQLIGDGVTVMLTKKGITQMEKYDYKLLKDKYGLAPEQVIDFKALKGDPSDNIPGVPGIGDKTARNLLEEYGTLENIYDNIDQLKPKMASKLQEYREPLYTGRELVTLRRDVPIDCDWEACRYSEPDYEKLIDIFSELEFKSLVKKYKPAGSHDGPQAAGEMTGKQIENIEQLEQLLADLNKEDKLALSIAYYPGRPYWQQPVATLALALDNDRAYYLDLAALNGKEAEVWQKLADTRNRDITLVVHNVKQWYHLFARFSLKPPHFIFDTYLAAYLTDPARGGYNLPELLQYYLGLDIGSPVKNKKQALVDINRCGPQLAEEARNLFALRRSLQEELQEQQLENLLYDLEMPLASVLARMEQQGMTVDADYLRDLSAEICNRLEELEGKIYIQAGEEFNINSPQQLSRILFDKLQLPEVRKTKTGRSTDAKVLEELSYHHEIASLLLHYRQLAKLEGTYLSGLIELIDQENQKLYTTFNQAATATGRLSSSDPNLQNIPIRLDEGRRIRRAFIPSAKDKILFAADYSQVELRILAHLSQDPILIEAFKTGQDIHRRTAAEVNGIALEEVTSMMREKAKAVNFGIIYGSSDYGLAQNLKIARAEAKNYIDNYFDRYQGVREYMDKITSQAREQGYVTTMFKRRRYLPEIHSSNHNTRSFAERMALNTPIQGSAADILKLAMLKIAKIIGEGGFNAAMLLQIHDELLFEIEETELNSFASMVKREMEEACELSVPLQVDLKHGNNWEELKEL
ncbi:MAG: DNA polymerase I [Bacillota bacterium]